MKTIYIFLLSIGLCSAQDIAVQSVWQLPTNNWLVLAGAPTNMPENSFFTSNTNAVAGYTIYDLQTWIAYRAANQASWDAFMTNVWPSALSNLTENLNTQNNSNYNAWLSIYTNIPAGINDSSNRIVTVTNLFTSFISGTNSAAGTNSIIKGMLQQQMYTYVYLNQIINYLSKLGPGLQQTFIGAQPTQ